MAKLVVNGAKLECSQGLAPSTLAVLPVANAAVGDLLAATILDNKPIVNVAPFGMCQSPANPEVAAATAAAMGVLTPMPCIPVIPAPWSPGASATVIEQIPALDDRSKCSCTWAGSIEITDPGSDIEIE